MHTHTGPAGLKVIVAKNVSVHVQPKNLRLVLSVSSGMVPIPAEYAAVPGHDNFLLDSSGGADRMIELPEPIRQGLSSELFLLAL